MELVLGDVRVDSISDGWFRLDGGAMFGVVPKPLWSRVAPPDERNRILLALRVLLIRTRSEVVLVDTGIGDHWSAKEREIYAIDAQPGLLAALAERGVRPEDVTHVINTHLHFDHAGGNTRETAEGVVAAFPHATYVVQEEELAWAHRPTLRDRASYLERHFVPVEAAGRWAPVRGDASILPAVRVVRLPGHTPHLQGVLIEAAGETVFFPSDLVPTAAHLPFPWVMAYDLLPLETLATKTRYLTEAAQRDWVVAFQHDPVNRFSRIDLINGRPALRDPS